MIRRPPRSTQSRSSAASDVYKRQVDAGLLRGDEEGALGRVAHDRPRPVLVLAEFGCVCQDTGTQRGHEVTACTRVDVFAAQLDGSAWLVPDTCDLSLIHISEPTRLGMI